jgi:hypothetical protein
MEQALPILGLVALVALMKGYRRESIEEPATSLPIIDEPDPRRWRHDGQQPRRDTYMRGNHMDAAEWPNPFD